MRRILYFSLFLSLTAFFSCKKDHSSDVLKIQLSDEPDKLQPFFASNAYSRQISRHIFLTLMEFDPVTYQYSPVLLKSMPTVTDIDSNKTLSNYQFELLEEAVWDNGKPVTSEDVLFTIKLIMNPKTQATKWRPFYTGIRHFVKDASNPKKFSIIAEHDLLTLEAFGSLYIMPEYNYDPQGLMKNIALEDLVNPTKSAELATQNADIQKFADFSAQANFSRDASAISGSGAYKLEKWETGQFVLLKKKENWWGDKFSQNNNLLKSNVSQLLYKVVKEDAASIAELKNGNIDIVSQLKADAFFALKNEGGDKFYFENPSTLMYGYYAINTQNPKFSDVRVRKALSHLNDQKTIVEKILKGLGQGIASPVLPDNPMYNKNLKPIGFDPTKATQLLSEAGWKDSDGDGVLDRNTNGKKEDMIVNLLFTPQGSGKDVALLFQENCKKVGVKVELVPKDLAAIKTELKTRNYDLAALATISDLSLPDLNQSWHTSSNTPDGGNISGFGTPETDKIIDEIRDSRDMNRRKELYYKMQEIIQEQCPYILLANPKDRIVISKKFKPALTIKRTGFGGYVEEAFSAN